MTDQPAIADTGERMVPEFHRGTLLYAEHLTRYTVAAEAVRGLRVLDIASGSGYGSRLLADSAASVIGVDASLEAVTYARAHFSGSNVEFRHGDATAIPLEDDSVDVVVSFETIEHIDDYEKFLAEIDRVLAPDGILLLSTPNDPEFVEDNHFHLHEFVRDELLSLVRTRFEHVDEYFQSTWKAVTIGTEAQLTELGALEVPLERLSTAAPEQCLYFYLVCSRVPVTTRLTPLAALGERYSDRALQEIARDASERITRLEAELDTARQDLVAIRATRSYRLAHRLSTVWGSVRRTPTER
ncbi:class I SAM-dependent methyltransferase [Cellulomonas soli]|uniref:class I SAM-dependent methyltransferase n=1 Tax=Cellulomonas soli TaxID=931535 RepID=UPI003F84117F